MQRPIPAITVNDEPRRYEAARCSEHIHDVLSTQHSRRMAGENQRQPPVTQAGSGGLHKPAAAGVHSVGLLNGNDILPPPNAYQSTFRVAIMIADKIANNSPAPTTKALSFSTKRPYNAA